MSQYLSVVAASCLCVGLQAAESPKTDQSTRIALALVSTDASPGPQEDLDKVISVFADGVESIKRANGLKIKMSDPVRSVGPQSKNDLFNEIGSMICDAETTVVCYAKLHGGILDGNYVMQTEDGNTFQRVELLKHLQRQYKSARLIILVTDSCSKRIDVRQSPPGVMANKFPTELFRHLFIAAKGVVDINSSSTGEASWVDRSGGLFTAVFTETLSPRDPDSLSELLNRIDQPADALGKPDGVYSWNEFFGHALLPDTKARFATYRDSVKASRVSPQGIFFQPDDRAELLEQPTQTPYNFGKLPEVPALGTE
jgi:hypothetical protein